MLGMALLPGLGLFGTLLSAGKGKSVKRKAYRWIGLVGLLVFVSLIALGCGGSNSSHSTTPASSQVTLMVTGTSGSLSHSVPVTVTIN